MAKKGFSYLWTEIKKYPKARLNAIAYFTRLMGYKLVGNPYVRNVDEEIETYLAETGRKIFFAYDGRFLCSYAK